MRFKAILVIFVSLGLWGCNKDNDPAFKAEPHPAPIVSPYGSSFLDACAAGPTAGLLPNVCFVDPAFENGTIGSGGDDHPNSDIRLGERFIADAHRALADNGGWPTPSSSSPSRNGVASATAFLPPRS